MTTGVQPEIRKAVCDHSAAGGRWCHHEAQVFDRLMIAQGSGDKARGAKNNNHDNAKRLSGRIRRAGGVLASEQFITNLRTPDAKLHGRGGSRRWEWTKRERAKVLVVLENIGYSEDEFLELVRAEAGE